MPIVQINLLQGRDPALVSDCLREVALAIHRTLGAPLETIRVIATEIAPSHWAVGDRTRDEIERAKKQAG